MERVLTRRSLLALGAAGAVGAIVPGAAASPRSGGTLRLRGWDPPHFDPMLTSSSRTQMIHSFTHSRLLRFAAGPAVRPGELRVEGDLAESWSQPTETTYVFKLRKGAHWHPLPPVNGRELTAADVAYSIERFRRVPGNPQAHALGAVDRVEALDRHTVRVSLRERFVWFPEALATASVLPIVARECVERFGDLKKPEALVGTGPFMLERHEPGARTLLRRHPAYFVPGLPHIERIELIVDEDNASRIAAFLAGRYDLGWEFPGTVNRTDWVQFGRQFQARRPGLQTAEFAASGMTVLAMRADRPPFSDVRVRRALSMAINRQEFIGAVHEGVGAVNPPIPSALRQWALPVTQLGEGARYYEHDPATARKFLAEAGYPKGFAAPLELTSFGSSLFTDAAQLVVKYLKDVGVTATIVQKEYGAYAASTLLGKYEGMTYFPTAAYLEPDSYLYNFHFPGLDRNLGHVDDRHLADLLTQQRRTADVASRREILHEIQRHLAAQQYYIAMPSPVYIAVWDGALKGYAPNLGFDYGGRLAGAWLER